jgi:hypothetical protein
MVHPSMISIRLFFKSSSGKAFLFHKWPVDEMEFIGDAVLHIIFTMSVGQMTELRSQLERNSNLFIYASELDLCERDRALAMKSCADIFEALYLHLFYAKSLGYASLGYIESWLQKGIL